MKFIIIDTSGSVSDEELKAGKLFAQSLMKDERAETYFVVFWSNLDYPFLDDLTARIRKMYTNCTISFITDGILPAEEMVNIDQIYIYEDAADIANGFIGTNIKTITIPVVQNA